MSHVHYLQMVVADSTKVAKRFAEEWKGMTYSEAEDGSPRLELGEEDFAFGEVTRHFRPSPDQVVVRGMHEGEDIGLVFIPFLFRGGAVTHQKRRAERTEDDISKRVATYIDDCLPDAAELPSWTAVTGYRRGSDVEVVIQLESGGELSASARLASKPKDGAFEKAVEKILDGLVREARELGYLE